MSTFPSISLRGERTRQNLVLDPADYTYLVNESHQNEIGQSELIHLLIDLMRLRYTAAEDDGNQELLDQFPSQLEAYIWLVAMDAGLVTQDEMASAGVYAEMAGPLPNMRPRLDTIINLMQRRWEEKHEPYDFDRESPFIRETDE